MIRWYIDDAGVGSRSNFFIWKNRNCGFLTGLPIFGQHCMFQCQGWFELKFQSTSELVTLILTRKKWKDFSHISHDRYSPIKVDTWFSRKFGNIFGSGDIKICKKKSKNLTNPFKFPGKLSKCTGITTKTAPQNSKEN